MTGLHEIVLRSEEMEVVILPDVGGRIHRIRAFGQDLLRTPDDPAVHTVEPFLWGAYVMSPWCNRAAPGTMVVAGREVTLAANFPDGTAIHGLVSSAGWIQRPNGDLAFVGGGGAWPWAFEVSQSASLSGTTLTLEYRVRNLDDAPMPAGIGLHPWFRRPLEVRLPAEAVYYELVCDRLGGTTSPLTYALERNVIPVSPSTLHAYLLVLVLGFKGLQIEQHAREVMTYVADLGRDFDRFKADFDVVGKHLGNAQTKYGEAEKRLSRFETKLEQAAESELVTGDRDERPPAIAEPGESVAELPRARDAA